MAVIGDFGVGKTSLIHALTEREFMKDPESTIGASFTQLAITRRDLIMMNRLNYETSEEMLEDFFREYGPMRQIQIWDTAGAEQYRSIIPIYLRTASLVIICFEASNEHAASEVLTWRNVCNENGIENENIILVATKEDLVDRRTGGVYLMPDIMTSAKTGSGIEMLKTTIIYRAIRDVDLGNNPKSVLDNEILIQDKKKCC